MANKIDEKMRENNIMFIPTKLTNDVTDDLIFRIMACGSATPEAEINIYVSSTAYNYLNLMAVYDALKNAPNPKSVFCIGSVGGFGLLILDVASEGHRYALRHTEFSIDQPYGFFDNGVQQQTEVEIMARETTREREVYEEILAHITKKPLDEIHRDVEKDDLILKAEQAKEYGLIDVILG